jgi:hypothetical protein
MIIIFGGYRVTFSAGEEPVYLQLAWPTRTDPMFIKITRDEAALNARHSLAGLDLVAVEQRERKGITYEVQLYGRPGAYLAEPISKANLDQVEWPEEIDVPS